MHPQHTVTPVDDGVFFVEGPASNWTILTDGSSATLVDAGYPGDAALVERTLRETVGALPLSDLIVTHAHSDHIGSIPALAADRPTLRVWAAAAEAPHVRREVLHQFGVRDLLPRIGNPRYARWAVHALRAGGLRPLEIREVRELPLDGPVMFSGHAVVPRLTPGHTPGHVILALPGSGALITGDALITAHPTVTTRGRQGLAPVWHWDAERAAAVTAELLDDPRAILPGHGPLHRA